MLLIYFFLLATLVIVTIVFFLSRAHSLRIKISLISLQRKKEEKKGLFLLWCTVVKPVNMVTVIFFPFLAKWSSTTTKCLIQCSSSG